MQVFSKYWGWRYNFTTAMTPDWHSWYMREVECRHPHCLRPARAWSDNPKPLRPEYFGSFPGVTHVPVHCPVALYRTDFWPVIGHLFPSALVEPVQHLGAGTVEEFVAVQVPREEFISPYRGAGCEHRQCPTCALVVTPFYGKQAIVEGHLRGRSAVMDCAGFLYIDQSVAEGLRLRERFEDVRYVRISVRTHADDGWTLPGDPGWTGTLVVPPAAHRSMVERDRWFEEARRQREEITRREASE